MPTVRVEPANTGIIRAVPVEKLIGSEGQIKTTTMFKVADPQPVKPASLK